MASATNVDLQDMTAIMDLMTQCGINPMDLVAGATPTVPGVATTVLVGGADRATVPSIPPPRPPCSPCSASTRRPPSASRTACSPPISPGDDNEALAILQVVRIDAQRPADRSRRGQRRQRPGQRCPWSRPCRACPRRCPGPRSGPLVQQLIDTVQQQYGIDADAGPGDRACSTTSAPSTPRTWTRCWR